MLLLNPERHTIDAVRRDTFRAKTLFTRARQVETKYAAALRKIAVHVGHLIAGFPAGDPAVLPDLNAALTGYSKILTPWAKNTAKRILQEVAHWDEVAWVKHAREMSKALAVEVESADVGAVFQALQDEQVILITSIPTVAAQRVHEFTMKALVDSSRAKVHIDEILRSGHVAKARANTIARTEVSRASTNFTQARALHLGSPGYYWETVRDSRVRQIHRKLQGKFIAWDDPPVAGSNGERAHAGAIYNCRCWPRPIFNAD